MHLGLLLNPRSQATITPAVQTVHLPDYGPRRAEAQRVRVASAWVGAGVLVPHLHGLRAVEWGLVVPRQFRWQHCPQLVQLAGYQFAG